MFGPAGHFYIYRVYGLHWMLNVVTGNTGDGAAVLIRGLLGISGPGRLTAALKIDRRLNGKPAIPETNLWFESPSAPHRFKIRKTARIGVAYAGPLWAGKKLRYVAWLPDKLSPVTRREPRIIG
jgi:DNA-3-methyladenine glycosylase